MGTDVLNWDGVQCTRTRESQLLTRKISDPEKVTTVQSDVSVLINTPLVDDVQIE